MCGVLHCSDCRYQADFELCHIGRISGQLWLRVCTVPCRNVAGLQEPPHLVSVWSVGREGQLLRSVFMRTCEAGRCCSDRLYFLYLLCCRKFRDFMSLLFWCHLECEAGSLVTGASCAPFVRQGSMLQRQQLLSTSCVAGRYSGTVGGASSNFCLECEAGRPAT